MQEVELLARIQQRIYGRVGGGRACAAKDLVAAGCLEVCVDDRAVFIFYSIANCFS